MRSWDCYCPGGSIECQNREGLSPLAALLAVVAQIYIDKIADREKDVAVGLGVHYLGKLPLRGERLV